MEMFGVKTVESPQQSINELQQENLLDASVPLNADTVPFDMVRLAGAIIEQAMDDITMSPYGRGENERIGQDRERVLEIIGEAQWFFLDDNDEVTPHSFPWCCHIQRLEPSAVRRRIRSDLVRKGFILPKAERHRLAHLAGVRRMRTIDKPTPSLSPTQSCTDITIVRLACAKCLRHFKTPRIATRRRFCCEKCTGKCVRKDCWNPRRPGSNTTTCREHYRSERKAKRLDVGQPYRRPSASALF